MKTFATKQPIVFPRPIVIVALAPFALASVALAATIVWSHPAAAHHKPGHNPPGHNQSGKAKKFNSSKSNTEGFGDVGKRGGPPPWAPAHGYRGKKFKYRQDGQDRYIEPETLVRVPTVGAATCNRERLGEVLGGIAGAAAGSQIGKGDGQILATLGGTILGVLVGGSIGRKLDRTDQNCVGQVLERVATGQDVMWRNLDRGGQYQVTPTNTFRTSSGQYCRDYQVTVNIGGRPENAVGTACRRPDGTWKRVL